MIEGHAGPVDSAEVAAEERADVPGHGHRQDE